MRKLKGEGGGGERRGLVPQRKQKSGCATDYVECNGCTCLLTVVKDKLWCFCTCLLVYEYLQRHICQFHKSILSRSAFLTARQHSLATIDSVWPSDRPTVWSSDRPSVTVRYHAKTTPATIMRSSIEDSPMALVSWRLTSPRTSKGNIGSEGAEWERGSKNVAKIGNF